MALLDDAGPARRGGRRVFSTEIALRWSDLDTYGHVNHARTVTILEEARVRLLFTEAAGVGVEGLAKGAIVVRISIAYKRPLLYSPDPVRVDVSVRTLRAASFVLDHVVVAAGARAVEAEALIAPYDVAASRPRLLTPAEREFLSAWSPRGATVEEDGA